MASVNRAPYEIAEPQWPTQCQRLAEQRARSSLQYHEPNEDDLNYNKREDRETDDDVVAP
jgi:hypothetical protein